MVLVGAVSVGVGTASAEELNAGTILNRFSAEQQSAYFAGVVEGVAFTRYLRDTSTKEAMACVYRWYYDRTETVREIVDAFRKYPDYTPGALIVGLVQKECGV